MKILITGCGRHQNALVRRLKNNRDHREVEVIGINSSSDNLLRTGVDEYMIAPLVLDPKYPDWLLNLCAEKKVDVVLPFVQAELAVLAEHRKKLESLGTKISVASPETLSILNDKTKMAEHFPELMPRQRIVHTSEEIMAFAKDVGYFTGTNICCKIQGRCGGTGFAVLDEQKAMDVSLFNRCGMPRYITIGQLCEITEKVHTQIILQEYIKGTDYSVAVLADNGWVQGICGFAGYFMEYGSVMSGEIIKNVAAYEIAERISVETGLDGNACFDFMIRPDGTPVLLECNPRINATIAFVEMAGGDFVYQRCRRLMGESLGDVTYDIDYGLRMVNYYDPWFFHEA